jgi:hypothetical protein
LLFLAIQKQIGLNLRDVFHGDVRCVTKRQTASELAVAIHEVFEGHIFLSPREIASQVIFAPPVASDSCALGEHK